MRIVRFKTGKYGIERGWIFKKYADVRDRYWFGEILNVVKYCQFDTLEDAQARLAEIDIFPVTRVAK